MRIRIKLASLLLLTAFLMFPGRLLGSEDSFEQGLSHLTSERYEAAEKVFSSILAANPNNAEAWCNRGVVRFFRSEYDQAAADFTKALEINPRYALAYCNRGILWIEKTSYDRAIDDFSEALKINPQYSEAYFSRGVAWVFKGIYDSAITDFTKALEINATDADAYTNRGILWAREASYDRAVKDLTKAMELSSRRPEAIDQLAWIKATCPDSRYRDGPKAVKLAQKAIQFAPESRFKATLAAAYAEAGRFEEAKKTQKKVISSLIEESKTEGLDEYKRQLMSYEAYRPWRASISIREDVKPSIESSNQIKPVVKQEAKKVMPSGQEEKKVSTIFSKEGPILDPSHKIFSVQAGAFLIQKNAEECRDLLTKKGYAAYIMRKSDARGKVWNCVLVGDYATHAQAEKAATAFSTKEKKPSYVTIIEAP